VRPTEATDDRETPGTIYSSHTASRGQVVWYSPLDPEGADKIVVTIPEEYATGELYDRLEALVREAIAEHGGGPRAHLQLVVRK